MKRLKYYFYFNILSYFRFKPFFRYNSLLWKEKYDTPRVELVPRLLIMWLKFEFIIYKGTDCWWERWLWLHKFCDSNIEKAKNTWPWININENNKNSWDNY